MEARQDVLGRDESRVDAGRVHQIQDRRCRQAGVPEERVDLAVLQRIDRLRNPEALRADVLSRVEAGGLQDAVGQHRGAGAGGAGGNGATGGLGGGGGGAKDDPGSLLSQADDLWNAGKKSEAAAIYKRLRDDFKLSVVYALNKDRIKDRSRWQEQPK